MFWFKKCTTVTAVKAYFFKTLCYVVKSIRNLKTESGIKSSNFFSQESIKIRTEIKKNFCVELLVPYQDSYWLTSRAAPPAAGSQTSNVNSKKADTPSPSSKPKKLLSPYRGFQSKAGGQKSKIENKQDWKLFSPTLRAKDVWFAMHKKLNRLFRHVLTVPLSKQGWGSNAWGQKAKRRKWRKQWEQLRQKNWRGKRRKQWEQLRQKNWRGKRRKQWEQLRQKKMRLVFSRAALAPPAAKKTNYPSVIVMMRLHSISIEKS